MADVNGLSEFVGFGLVGGWDGSGYVVDLGEFAAGVSGDFLGQR